MLELVVPHMNRHYDLTYLNHVFHGNESMVHEIVQLFLIQAPQYGHDMTSCIRQARWSDLHPLAHKMKSSVNMLGMAGLVTLILDIEHTSKFGKNPSKLPGLVSELTSEMEVVCEVLSKDLRETSLGREFQSKRLRRA